MYQGAVSHVGAKSVSYVLWYIRSSTVVVRSGTAGKSSAFGSDTTPWVTGAGGASASCECGGQGHMLVYGPCHSASSANRKRANQ